MWRYVFGSARYTSPWQRVFAFDALTYVLQAIAAQVRAKVSEFCTHITHFR